MKRFLEFLTCILIALICIGCVRGKPALKPGAKADVLSLASPLPPYAGTRASIAVVDFEVSAVKAQGAVGSGIREMLVTALSNSKRFNVVEPDFLNAAEKIDSSLSRVNNVDVIITGVVTEFEPQASGGSGGVGGGGGANSGAWGGLLGTALNQAHLALEIRIVNALTTESIAATRVQGQASDVSGSIMAGGFENWRLGSGLSLYANTPMEKAIRVCIIEAVHYISNTIPASLYKY